MGEEALIESTQELILSAPLMLSRFFKFKNLFLEMEMHPGGPTGGFSATAVKMEEFETATDIAMFMISASASETTTFCFVISSQNTLQTTQITFVNTGYNKSLSLRSFGVRKVQPKTKANPFEKFNVLLKKVYLQKKKQTDSEE